MLFSQTLAPIKLGERGKNFFMCFVFPALKLVQQIERRRENVFLAGVSARRYLELYTLSYALAWTHHSVLPID